MKTFLIFSPTKHSLIHLNLNLNINNNNIIQNQTNTSSSIAFNDNIQDPKIKSKNWPRSPPRLAELQSDKRVARSSNLALPETMSSRMDLSWDTALSLVVFMITRPSGSFHEAFLREPWCLISMCDALTWLVVAVVFDDDILVFFFCLCLSLSLSLDDEIDDEVFFRLRSEESILAEWIEDRELKGFVLVLSVVCAVLLLGFWLYKLCLFIKVSFCVLSILDLGSLAHMEPQHWWSIDRLQFLASTKYTPYYNQFHNCC